MIERHHFQSIPSTQDLAKTRQDQLRGETWRLITADEQTQGRATHNKNWQSPPHVNLYATFSLLIPPAKNAVLFNVPQVTAYSIIKALQQFGFTPKFKWVNDILINRKKICGILCESFGKVLHIGMGINVNMPQAICEQLDQPVTSLMVVSGREIDKEQLLTIIQAELYKNINQLFTESFAPFHTELDEFLEYKNEEIMFDPMSANTTVVKGLLLGIDQKGQLILKLPNDEIKIFYNGRLVRPQ